MSRTIQTIALAAILTAPAFANDAIQQVNNQESLSIGIAPLHASEVAYNPQGTSFVNNESGTRYLFGYDNARTRTIFGIPNLYTDLEVSLGFATLGYYGNSISQTTGAGSAVNQPVSYTEEAVRIRVGRSYEFFESNNVALTPFLGISQQAWARDSTANGSATVYDQEGIEAGVLVQASLPYNLVLGADAAVGRALGAVLFDGGFGNLTYAGTSSFALKLDHRTFKDWHQRLEIRQTFLRYGQPANVSAFFEPRRSSELAIMLEVGTETSLF
jgi:hypothetical protein